jgi:hypothetical protein
MTSSSEGRLVDESVVTILAMRFTKLDDKSRLVIRDIANEANGSITMNPPTERRIGIARILLEIAENDGHVDKDYAQERNTTPQEKPWLTCHGLTPNEFGRHSKTSTQTGCNSNTSQ